GHVLVVGLVQHGETDGNGEDDGGAGHVADDGGHQPGIARASQGIGQLVATHVNGDQGGGGNRRVGTHRGEDRSGDDADELREVGDRGHDPGDRNEDRADGIEALDELLAEAAFGLADGGHGTGHGTGHDDVDHEGTDLF